MQRRPNAAGLSPRAAGPDQCDGRHSAIQSWQHTMAVGSQRNFHVPLSVETYRALRSEADRQRRAATALVREAVEDWLERQRAEALHADIVEYAARHAGSPADLDLALEAAGIDTLVGEPRKSGRTRRKATSK
jgi:hypothetical protein